MEDAKRAFVSLGRASDRIERVSKGAGGRTSEGAGRSSKESGRASQGAKRALGESNRDRQ